jgi:pimeloyl-ACP methyl ester carboxylesterase
MTGSLMHHDTGSHRSNAGMTRKKRQGVKDAANLRRLYIDCRYGQMHLTTAYPSSGGFGEASPLVFLHDEEGSGADFNDCAALLGRDRSVYAPDLPGSGASDSPPGRVTASGLADAIGDLIDQLRLREVDVFGCGRGAQVAFDLAAARPQDVRRLIVSCQQPAAATSKPLLQLGADPASVLAEPPESVVAAIREFLDGD